MQSRHFSEVCSVFMFIQYSVSAHSIRRRGHDGLFHNNDTAGRIKLISWPPHRRLINRAVMERLDNSIPVRWVGLLMPDLFTRKKKVNTPPVDYAASPVHTAMTFTARSCFHEYSNYFLRTRYKHEGNISLSAKPPRTEADGTTRPTRYC